MCRRKPVPINAADCASAEHAADRWQLDAVITVVRSARAAACGGCPRCGSARVIGWGGFAGRSRYRCNACGRTFSDFTATPIAYSKRAERWGEYARCMRLSMTVRQSAAQVGVTPPTVFRWRHALLTGLRHAPEPLLRGSIDLVDATYRRSEKGSRRRDLFAAAGRVRRVEARVIVLFGADSTGETLAELLERPHLTTAEVERVVDAAVAPRSEIRAPAGKFSAYAVASRRGGHRYSRLPAWSVRRGRRLPGGGDLARAASLRLRYEAWVERFRGVATRYLANYLRWSRFLGAARRPAREAARRLLELCCVGSLVAASSTRPTIPLNKVAAGEAHHRYRAPPAVAAPP